MALLRDLLYGYGEGEVINPQEFMVYNTNTRSTSNGGQCCLWTVPSGVSYAIFEMWSAGGSGGSGCCCMQGGGAGSGGYAIKSCTVSPGQQIRICAATSGCCAQSNNGGICGCCTFVCSLGGGGEGTWESKVCGGRGATVETRCFYYANCYSCCSSCYCCGGIANNADECVPGTTGTGHASQYCYDTGYQIAANAPHAGGGHHMGPNGCCGWGGSNGFGNFPGGGGLSTQAYGGGCCCGGPGGGGLVYVVYY